MAGATSWWLYVLRTRDGNLYTGIATDVERRLEEHRAGRGAKALRGRAPLELTYSCEIGARGEALRLEAAVKRLPKVEKERLVVAAPRAKALADRLP